MDISVINIKDKCQNFKELHSYKIIAQMNNYYFKLVKVKRVFVWHKHVDTDEVFLVIEGHLQINLRDKTLKLNQGELVVIPRGVEHKTVAREECTVLLIEPVGTLNTGNVGGEMTETSLEWI